MFNNPHCVPNKPLEKVNGYNIRVNIESKDNMPMSELDFQVEFWIDDCRRKVVIGKHSMSEINGQFFAQLYDYELGDVRGWLMATVAIQQPDENWNCGYRDVTIEHVFTGIYLGHSCDRLPRAPRHCCSGKKWINGFKVNFDKVDYLPESNEDNEEENNGGTNKPSESMEILYGVIRGLSAFGAITPEQLSGLSKLTSKPSGMTSVPVTVGDTLVVLTTGASVMKDDGVGGKSQFDTSVMGANGEDVTINGKAYKVYGETFLVSGSIGFYVI